MANLPLYRVTAIYRFPLLINVVCCVGRVENKSKYKKFSVLPIRIV